MKKLLIITLFLPYLSFAQFYDLWITGDSLDVETNHKSGIVLAGGGGDNDDAMKWMLRRAEGGDVVVIRASGSDGYNSYFYEELGITVNSVTTILFKSRQASFDTAVINMIKSAEVLFIAGGDQTRYKNYWENTPVQATLQNLVDEKKITIGGTSAGMAILGDYFYAPVDLGVTSQEATNDPFHPYMDSIYATSIVNFEILRDVLTDTHFDDRDRKGRLVTMMARMINDYGIAPRAIAANEYTSVCIDEGGLAWVFGEHPEYPDYAYFIQGNCEAASLMPETIEPQTPLHWQLEGYALKVYKIGGRQSQSRYFDLNNWQEGQGGNWENWSVDQGQLIIQEDAMPPCVVTSIEPNTFNLIYNNPVYDQLKIESENQIRQVAIYNLTGQLVHTSDFAGDRSLWLNLNHLTKGQYIVNLTFEKQVNKALKIIKR